MFFTWRWRHSYRNRQCRHAICVCVADVVANEWQIKSSNHIEPSHRHHIEVEVERRIIAQSFAKPWST